VDLLGLTTGTEQDLEVDGDWLPLAIEKSVLPPDGYTWSSEDKIPDARIARHAQVVVAYNAGKKIKYRIKANRSSRRDALPERRD
jgi:hypothetical protein